MNPPSPNPQHVLAPHLRSLKLDVYVPLDSSAIHILLDNLNLPNLHELQLTAVGYLTMFFGNTNFSSFILRSTCLLRSLSLSGFLLNDDDLLQCMQILPSLEVFQIWDSLRPDHRVADQTITNQTIRNLTPNISPNLTLLPNLRELWISSSRLIIDAFELHSMMCARWRPGDAGFGPGVAQLRSVTISADWRHDETEKLELLLLSELIAEGMEVSLSLGTFGVPQSRLSIKS